MNSEVLLYWRQAGAVETCTRVPSGQPQIRDVAEVARVERPNGGATDDGARGNREIDFAAARPRRLLVESRGE